MKQRFNQNPHKWLFLSIAGLFSITAFLPYMGFKELDFDKKNPLVETVYYSWDWLSFQIHFSFAAIILLVSLASKELLRISGIRIMLVLMIPFALFTFLGDNAFMIGLEFPPVKKTGCYFSYLGFLMTFIYGILNSLKRS